jgi:hypothetical protein
MVSNRKTSKTIHSEAREMINHANRQYKQAAVEKSLILHICCADEREVNFCGRLVATVKQIRQDSREKNYADLKPYIFYKVRMFPEECQPALPRSELFS